MTPKEISQLNQFDWVRFRSKMYRVIRYCTENDTNRLHVRGHGQNFFNHGDFKNLQKWSPAVGEICVFGNISDMGNWPKLKESLALAAFKKRLGSNTSPEQVVYEDFEGETYKHVYPIDYAVILRGR